MYKISMISEVHGPILLITPLCLEIPTPIPEFPSYLLGILPLRRGAIPVHSDPRLAVYCPPPLSSIPFSPSPTVPHFKYMPSYDDITISTSHSPIHGLLMVEISAES